MDTIYVESAVRFHPRTESILARFPRAAVFECARFSEVFNVRAQNFRLQKRNPALILAEKHGKTVLPTPPDYSIGASRNFYFSHMLNCLYDCRYCFLQGMYQSANYVHFVNYETFESGIEEIRSAEDTATCFFSGYDCDSLAMEGITGFAAHFVPYFSGRPDALLELRTKSINTGVLERCDPVSNIVIAYTLTPDLIAREIEHGAPSFEKRLKRVRALTQQGWMAGLRLDPLIPWPGFRRLYREMIEAIFREVEASRIHSVTLGPMRFPAAMYEKIVKLYPSEPLFARGELSLRDGQMSYSPELEEELVGEVFAALATHLTPDRIFRQTSGG